MLAQYSYTNLQNLDCRPKRIKKKKKKKKKKKLFERWNTKKPRKIQTVILPTQTKTVICYKTDPSSRPGGRLMTAIPQLPHLRPKSGHESHMGSTPRRND
jgi:hypothetical protein